MKKENIAALKAKYPNHIIKQRPNGTVSMSLKFEEKELKLNKDTDQLEPTGKMIPEKSKTQQEFKDEVNINNIIKKYKSGQVVTHIMSGMPMFDDVSELMTYQEALNLQIKAGQNFAKLPSKVRAYFGNKPKNLIEFMNDSNNRDKAIELGFIDKPKPTPPPAEPKTQSEASPMDNATPPLGS